MSGELHDLVDELLVAYRPDDRRAGAAPLLARVRALFPPGSDPFVDFGRKRKGRGSAREAKSQGAVGRAPVNLLAFELVLEVEAGARRLEAEARDALGFTHRRRPPTSCASLEALRALPDLAEALDGDDDLRREVEKSLSSWHLRARQATGFAERWPRVLTFTDTETDERVEAVCPCCKAKSLRRRDDGCVVCCTPRCRDEATGRRPLWRPEQLRHLGLVLREAS